MRVVPEYFRREIRQEDWNREIDRIKRDETLDQMRERRAEALQTTRLTGPMGCGCAGIHLMNCTVTKNNAQRRMALYDVAIAETEAA